MKSVRALVVGAAATTISFAPSGTALAKDQAPPNAPPPLTYAERNAGSPDVPFSDVITATSAPVVAQGAVHAGEPLLSVAYAYRYTAVITEEVKGFSFTVGGVQAPVGSPGYYAGTFMWTNGRWPKADTPPMDLWCFFPGVAGGKRETICLLRNLNKRAAIAPTRMNPYLWHHFAPITGSFDYVNTPIFKRQAVDLPVKPVLEYRFSKWKGDMAWFGLYAMGGFVTDLPLEKDERGAYRLRTVGGDFLITRDSADPAAVRIVPEQHPPVS